MARARISFIALEGVPLIGAGDDVAALIAAAAEETGVRFEDGDIIVIAQKIVSKSEGRLIDLADVSPSPRAAALARELGKDPRLVEAILSESRAVVAKGHGVLVTEHHCGAVLANAGLDRSNVSAHEEEATLLPEDPDASAARLREDLRALTGAAPGVIITDTAGRPWRLGTTNFALGLAGLAPLDDHRGSTDLFGRTMEASIEAVADEIAAGAGLVMGQTHEKTPAVLVRGYGGARRPLGAAARDLLRPRGEDLFRSGDDDETR